MKEEHSENGNNSLAFWILLVGIPIIIAIVYFKMEADDSSAAVLEQNAAAALPPQVAVPDTSVTVDVYTEVPDTVTVYKNIETDTRSAMEAGNEDGYWDGWYDGAETGERTRYDEHSNFASAADRQVYAENYREGYEKGFAEAKKSEDAS